MICDDFRLLTSYSRTEDVTAGKLCDYGALRTLGIRSLEYERPGMSENEMKAFATSTCTVVKLWAWPIHSPTRSWQACGIAVPQGQLAGTSVYFNILGFLSCQRLQRDRTVCWFGFQQNRVTAKTCRLGARTEMFHTGRKMAAHGSSLVESSQGCSDRPIAFAETRPHSAEGAVRKHFQGLCLLGTFQEATPLLRRRPDLVRPATVAAWRCRARRAGCLGKRRLNRRGGS